MLSKTFSAAGVSTTFLLKRGQRATYDIAGTFTGFVEVEKKVGDAWARVHVGVVDTGISGTLEKPPTGDRYDTYRFRARDTAALTVWTGSAIAQMRLEQASGEGVSAGATVEATEAVGVLHRTVITLVATSITLTDDAGQGQAGGVAIYTFPVGNILVLGAVIDASIALQGAPWTDAAEGDVGIGSVVTANGQALATTKQNILATTPIAAMVAQVGPIDAQSLATGVPLGSAGGSAAQAFLNVRIDDAAAHVTAAGLVTGTVELVWINLGNSA